MATKIDLQYTPSDKFSKIHIVATIEKIMETTNIVHNNIILVQFPFSCLKQYKLQILITFDDIITNFNDYKHI